VAFNWLIAGTDAHAKNYSLLIGGLCVRLAPLYDLASILPYDEFDLHKTQLAMKIGGEYRLRHIGLRQWRKTAHDLRIDPDGLIGRIAEMARQLPDELSVVYRRALEAGLDPSMIYRLTVRLIERATACGKSLASDAS